MEALALRVNAIIGDQLGVEQANLVPEANLLDDLGADSLDVVELVMALEEEFGVERVAQVVAGLSAPTAESACRELLHQVEIHVEGRPLQDDATLLVLTVEWAVVPCQNSVRFARGSCGSWRPLLRRRSPAWGRSGEGAGWERSADADSGTSRSLAKSPAPRRLRPSDSM